MDSELLFNKCMQIKNDELIPVAEKNAIVKAIEYHREICALAVVQSVNQRGVPRHERFALYKRRVGNVIILYHEVVTALTMM